MHETFTNYCLVVHRQNINILCNNGGQNEFNFRTFVDTASNQPSIHHHSPSLQVTSPNTSRDQSIYIQRIAMRIITGDECGLLKEVIPELCRPPQTDGSGRPMNNTPWGSLQSSSAPRPSATTIQAAASSYGTTNDLNGAIQRLEGAEDAQGRERGVVSMTFVPSDGGGSSSNGGDGGGFNFATLRMNGSIELWSASRTFPPTDTNEDGHSKNNNEANVTPARYQMLSSTNVMQNDEEDGSGSGGSMEEEENEDLTNSVNGRGINGDKDNGSKGWYHNPPIRPMAMVSRYSNFVPNNDNTTSTDADEGNNNNHILAACDSVGNISLVNAWECGKGVVHRYSAFFDDSSTNNNKYSKEAAVLTYTKGQYKNTSLATCVGMDGRGERLAVGGRERGVRVLDLESGRLLWKVGD